MGLPKDWDRVKHWLDYGGPIFFEPTPEMTAEERKWPDIPILSKYDGSAPDGYWDKFPFYAIPDSPVTQIDIDILEGKIRKVSHNLTRAQIQRANRAVAFLREGAPSCQRGPLGPCFVENSKGTLTHGAAVSDNIATWVSKGYAAGPFVHPPLADFRVNPLLAVIQPTKIRPVLNVSMPTNNSFNSNVEPSELEKVKMSSGNWIRNSLTWN